MRTTTILCDSCGNDLTYTGNCEDYYLTLASASKWQRGGSVTLMAISPPTDRDYTFCGLTCLDLWTARRQYMGKLRTEWYERYKVEHGNWRDGKCTSYITPSREIEDAREVEIEKMAAEKFHSFGKSEAPRTP